MVLLVCILKDYRRVEEVLLGFLEHGVTGATVMDARGMGQVLASELPIFAGVRGLFPGSGADSHAILSVMPRGKAFTCLDLVERVAGPFDAPGTGIVFTVALERAVGLAPEIS